MRPRRGLGVAPGSPELSEPFWARLPPAAPYARLLTKHWQPVRSRCTSSPGPFPSALPLRSLRCPVGTAGSGCADGVVPQAGARRGRHLPPAGEARSLGPRSRFFPLHPAARFRLPDSASRGVRHPPSSLLSGLSGGLTAPASRRSSRRHPCALSASSCRRPCPPREGGARRFPA